MEKVQFRDFIFLNNPRTIQVSSPKALVSHFCPGRGDVIQQLGRRARSIRFEGSFFGASYTRAMADLLRFRRSSADGEAGTLFLPGIPPLTARLRNFDFQASSDGRIIPYTMEFVEVLV